MNVLFLPESKGNPYQRLLAQALMKYGIEVIYNQTYPSERWLINHRHTIEVIHLHWLHALYRRQNHTLIETLRLCGKLLLSKLIGYKIVWTAHNIMPHDNRFPILDRFIRLVVIGLANTIITHSDEGRNQLHKRFRVKHKVKVTPHGNYCGAYPSKIPVKDARMQLGIDPDDFVYLFFGNIKPYKGVAQLIDSYNQLSGKSTLVIAGKCDPKERDTLLSMTSSNPHIKCHLEYVPDECVHLYFSAADVFVVPADNFLTSGSVILALSYGLPVIAPYMGDLPILIDPSMGNLYHQDKRDSLKIALHSIQHMDTTTMGRNALKKALELTWEITAKETSTIYNS